MNAPITKPAVASDPIMQLSALYPDIKGRAFSSIDSVDALIDDLPRRWQTTCPADATQMPLPHGIVPAYQVASRARARYMEETSKDDRLRRIVLAPRVESGVLWIDYAIVVDAAKFDVRAMFEAGEPAQDDAHAVVVDAAPAKDKEATQPDTAVTKPSVVVETSGDEREPKLMEAALGIVSVLSDMSIKASFVRAPETISLLPAQGYVIPVHTEMAGRFEFVRIAAYIGAHSALTKAMQNRDQRVIIYVDAERDRLVAHVVPGTPNDTDAPPYCAETFVDSLKATKARLYSAAAPGDLAHVSAESLEERPQRPAEIVALYPKLSADEAAKLLWIETAIADVPHRWSAALADGRTFSVAEHEATAIVLADRVRFISETYAKGQEVSLKLNDEARGLIVVVPWARSSPKEQTIEDLLDLYPMLTAREAIRLDNVVADLELIPTVWVDMDSGHGYDNNGVFESAGKLIDHVEAVYNEAKTKHADCHVVLSLHRLDDGSKDLIYSFAVNPTI